MTHRVVDDRRATLAVRLMFGAVLCHVKTFSAFVELWRTFLLVLVKSMSHMELHLAALFFKCHRICVSLDVVWPP